MLILAASRGPFRLRGRRTLTGPLLTGFAIALALHLAAIFLIDLRSPTFTLPAPLPPAYVSADLGVTVQVTGTEAAPVVDANGFLPRHAPVPDVPHPKLPTLPTTTPSTPLPTPIHERPTFVQLEHFDPLPGRQLFPKTYTPLTFELHGPLALIDPPSYPTERTTAPLTRLLIRLQLTVDTQRGTIARATPLDPIPDALAPAIDTLLSHLHFAPQNSPDPLTSCLLEVTLTQ